MGKIFSEKIDQSSNKQKRSTKKQRDIFSSQHTFTFTFCTMDQVQESISSIRDYSSLKNEDLKALCAEKNLFDGETPIKRGVLCRFRKLSV